MSSFSRASNSIPLDIDYTLPSLLSLAIIHYVGTVELVYFKNSFLKY